MSRIVRTLAPLVMGASGLVSSPRPARGAEAPSPNVTSSVKDLHLPEVTQVRLENGLTVVMEEDHRAPFVSLHLRYATGFSDDPRDKGGLALLTMRMMMNGTKHVPPGAYEASLDHVGASARGWETSSDATSEWATVPSSAVTTVLWLWSDQMGFFEPDDPKRLDAAKALSNSERREKNDNAAYGDVRELTLGALYPETHPYFPRLSRTSMEQISLDDVGRFQDRYYTPAGTTLAVSGDFERDTMLELVKTWFGPIPAGPPHPPKLEAARLDGDVRLDVAASVQAPTVTMTWRSAPWMTAGDAELDVLAGALAGSRVAYLYWALVDQAKLAANVRVWQSSRWLGSDFNISAVVAPGHTPDEVLKAIDASLVVLRRGVIKDEVIAKARETFLIPKLHRLEQATYRISNEAIYVGLKHDARWVTNDIGRYESLTPADVSIAMGQWITPRGRVITVVTPDPSAPPSGVLRGKKVTP